MASAALPSNDPLILRLQFFQQFSKLRGLVQKSIDCHQLKNFAEEYLPSLERSIMEEASRVESMPKGRGKSREKRSIKKKRQVIRNLKRRLERDEMYLSGVEPQRQEIKREMLRLTGEMGKFGSRNERSDARMARSQVHFLFTSEGRQDFSIVSLDVAHEYFWGMLMDD